MRVIAIMAVFNEQRFIDASLKHLIHQGVEVYLLDNESTDRTADIARAYLNRGLIAIETLPRKATFDLPEVLRKKEQLAHSLQADWFMHVDADEIHLPPRPDIALAEAFAEADAKGYNAVNFFEYTFIPTREAPDHDHPNFQQTMRGYYPFSPAHPRLIRAWKKQPAPVELAWSGGHRVRFPGITLYPQDFPMRHYLFLSFRHICEKYGHRRHHPAAVRDGLHGWRTRFTPEMVLLPDQRELCTYTSDACLNPANPRVRHYLEEQDWKLRRETALKEIMATVPEKAALVLADENQWGVEGDIEGRRCIPFTEHQGAYWGPPADDEAAIAELERHRKTGVGFFVFAWPAFWWITHYRQLYTYLCETHRCVLVNDRLIIFELKI